MPIHPIDSLDDPRLEPYRALKEREIIYTGRFIAEGEHLVRRLLASDYGVESVFIAEKHLEDMRKIVPDSVPLLVAPHALMHQTIGYKFHSGIIACGLKGDPKTLDQVVSATGPATLMILPEIANAENLGGLFRVAAGFGVSCVVLGERCCDPFMRQSVRVSMGTIFKLPLVQSKDIIADLHYLRDRFAIELMATVLDDAAEDLKQAQRSNRIGLLFGNEAQGLPREMVDLCQRKIMIPMKLGTDSLNVAVSAGICLHHFQ